MIWQCVTQSMIMICVVSGIKNESTRKFMCVCVILVSPALLSHLLLVHCPLPPLQNCVCVGECVKGGGWRVEGGKQGEE